MKIVFVSNFMNIHQQPLCHAFYQRVGDDFVFIETTPMDLDRVEMGFNTQEYPYVKNVILDDALRNECLKLILNSDVVIFGSAPDYLLQMRLKTKKLTFKYSERFFKGRGTVTDKIRFTVSSFKHIRPLKKANVYFLCASAYTSQDVNRFENFQGRCFKWGYFREVLPVSPDKLIHKKEKNSILWVARMIDWKHPELAVELASRLHQSGFQFTLKMVGTGNLKERVQKLVEDKNLQEYVHLLGKKNPDEVRNLMDCSDIFLGTSDYKEGWGVVINEAMNSCCAVVASHAMGAVPFLIEDGVNGLVFENGNIDSLYHKVSSVLMNTEKLRNLQKSAFHVLHTVWNAETAAERFLILAEELLDQKEITKYKNGPCSTADILENNWYQE